MLTILFTAGDEMFADSYPMREIQDGFFYEVDGKVCKDNGSHLACSFSIETHNHLNLLSLKFWGRRSPFAGFLNHG